MGITGDSGAAAERREKAGIANITVEIQVRERPWGRMLVEYGQPPPFRP